MIAAALCALMLVGGQPKPAFTQECVNWVRVAVRQSSPMKFPCEWCKVKLPALGEAIGHPSRNCWRDRISTISNDFPNCNANFLECISRENSYPQLVRMVALPEKFEAISHPLTFNERVWHPHRHRWPFQANVDGWRQPNVLQTNANADTPPFSHTLQWAYDFALYGHPCAAFGGEQLTRLLPCFLGILFGVSNGIKGSSVEAVGGDEKREGDTGERERGDHKQEREEGDPFVRAIGAAAILGTVIACCLIAIAKSIIDADFEHRRKGRMKHEQQRDDYL